QVEFDMLYDSGISREGCLLDMGVSHGIIQQSGTWFSYGDIRLGQGRENAKEFLRSNPKEAAEVERKIREKTGLIEAAPATT
ncbi:MAG: DNA recombination/repair protein RecA, partial [bacterium]